MYVQIKFLQILEVNLILAWQQENLLTFMLLRKVSQQNYHSLDSWDSVVTCFFIDTAHNICEYLECINKILKKGGIWVNLGPLLWHYSE